MKNWKILICFIVFFLFYSPLYAKNEYRDALTLSNLLDLNGKFIHEVNGRLLPDVETILMSHAHNLEAFNHAYQNNPFISQYVAPITFHFYDSLETAGVAGSGFLGGLGTAIGGLDVTTFADGVSKFLVERTKEELNEAFFRKFKTYLDNYPEFNKLFPNTSSFVNSFKSWEYSNLIGSLREAFDKDLQSFVQNFEQLKEINPATECASCMEAYKKGCSNRLTTIKNLLNTTEGTVLLSSMYTVNGVLNQQPVADIIDNLCGDKYLGSINFDATPQGTNAKNAIKLIRLLSNSIRGNSVTQGYISVSDFKQLKSNSIQVNLFLGLVLKQGLTEGIVFMITRNEIAASSWLTLEYLQRIMSFYNAVVVDCENIEESLAAIRAHRFDKNYDNTIYYSGLFQSLKNLITELSNISAVVPGLNTPPAVQTILNYINRVLPLGHDIAIKNYNAAIIDAIKILNDEAKIQGKERELTAFNSALLKYGSFAANVVNAKDADQVKESIKSFVLPSGSSSIKKHTEFSISVNSYVGLYLGYQGSKTENYVTRAQGTKDTLAVPKGVTYGIYAPIGLALNWGLGWNTAKHPASVTLFASLIDLGAIVGYRMVTDTGTLSNTTKVNLSNILAPGIGVAIGIPNVPLTVGFGYQWVPTLQRDPNDNSFYNLDHSGHRFQLFVGLDLPLLNVHTSKVSLLGPPETSPPSHSIAAPGVSNGP